MTQIKRILATGAAAVLLAFVVSIAAKNGMSGKIQPAPAPAFTLPTNDGGTISLASATQGKKLVLLNFWFAACPPCREEFPVLEKMYRANKDRGFEIVGINATDDAKTMQKFIKENDLTFQFARDDGAQVSAQYKVEATPTSILIDENGQMIWRSVGLDEAGLQAAINEHLGTA